MSPKGRKPPIDIKAIEEKAKFPRGEYVEVVVYNPRVAAGHPAQIFDEEVKEIIHIKRSFLPTAEQNAEKLFCFEIKGDSMMGAGIYEEDLCVFKPVYFHGEVKNKDIVLARIEGALTLKRILKNRRPHILRAENKNYPDIELKTEEHAILGKWLVVIGKER